MCIQLMYMYFGIDDFLRALFIESLVYVFIFSHIVVSGFHMIITRYIADKMYENDLKPVISSVFGILSVALPFGGVIGSLFLWWYCCLGYGNGGYRRIDNCSTSIS